MTSSSSTCTDESPSNRAGTAGLWIGILTAIWFWVPMLGVLGGLNATTDTSLVLGVIAAVLGGVGLYLCRKGKATNRRASGWAVVLGVVFGTLPSVLLILALGTWR